MSAGLVGESGSGKSPTSRIICRPIDLSESETAFEDSRSATSRHGDFRRHDACKEPLSLVRLQSRSAASDGVSAKLG
jgi:ABC-type glutathione transport system ATPase component